MKLVSILAFTSFAGTSSLIYAQSGGIPPPAYFVVNGQASYQNTVTGYSVYQAFKCTTASGSGSAAVEQASAKISLSPVSATCSLTTSVAANDMYANAYGGIQVYVPGPTYHVVLQWIVASVGTIDSLVGSGSSYARADCIDPMSEANVNIYNTEVYETTVGSITKHSVKTITYDGATDQSGRGITYLGRTYYLAYGGGPESAAELGTEGQVGDSSLEGSATCNVTLKITVFSPGYEPSVLITSPSNSKNTVVLKSDYVALTGVAPPNSAIESLVDGASKTHIHADADGQWEAVVKVGAGLHIVKAEMIGDPSSLSQPLCVKCPVIAMHAADKSFDWTTLQRGDVLLDVSATGSFQIPLYKPTSTHAAIYVGGDSSGTPLICEAVLGKYEQNRMAEVRAAPLEQSLVYFDGKTVWLRRLASETTFAQRVALASTGLSTVNGALGYWTFRMWFGEVSLSIYDYLNGPEAAFDADCLTLDGWEKTSHRYLCSTLVWQTYNDALGINIADPNMATINGILGFVGGPAFSAKFVPHFIVPDSLLSSTELQPPPGGH